MSKVDRIISLRVLKSNFQYRFPALHNNKLEIPFYTTKVRYWVITYVGTYLQHAKPIPWNGYG